MFSHLPNKDSVLYPGVRTDIGVISHPVDTNDISIFRYTSPPLRVIFLAVDLPFSAALDTLFLPIDLPLTPATTANAEKGFNHLHPSMTIDEYMKILGVPNRQYAPFEGRPPYVISIAFREGAI
jgi:hypothetical protein